MLPEAAVTTHPEVIRAVAIKVMEAGGDVYLGDSPAVGSLTIVLKRSGIMQVVKELGIEIVPFRTPVSVPVPAGGVYRSLQLASEVAGYDLIFNLPKFKVHSMMSLTLAVKNMFGTVVGAAKPGWHLQASNQLRFADMLLDVWRTLPPELNILDGITAMEGSGPRSGDPLDLGVLMASPSALAMDLIAGRIAGLPTEKHPVLYQAKARDLEGARNDQIQVLGEAVEDLRRAFLLPKNISKVDFPLPEWMRRSMRKSLNSFPQLNSDLCTTCGNCTAICPTEAITLHDRPYAGGIVNKEMCISCFCCHEVCPEKAIDLVPGRLLRVLKKVNFA
jgi:uncharacterized protein (DUF362 family)/NAD-dependent dihydropyrimidine dehydrogenase PreA subunit